MSIVIYILVNHLLSSPNFKCTKTFSVESRVKKKKRVGKMLCFCSVQTGGWVRRRADNGVHYTHRCAHITPAEAQPSLTHRGVVFLQEDGAFGLRFLPVSLNNTSTITPFFSILHFIPHLFLRFFLKSEVKASELNNQGRNISR